METVTSSSGARAKRPRPSDGPRVAERIVHGQKEEFEVRLKWKVWNSAGIAFRRNFNINLEIIISLRGNAVLIHSIYHFYFQSIYINFLLVLTL